MKKPLFSLLLCAACLTAAAQSFSTDFTCDYDADCAVAAPSKPCLFSVYPNPTPDFVTIEPPPQYVRVFDSTGRYIGTLNALPSAAQGIYCLHIQYADCTAIRRIVKL